MRISEVQIWKQNLKLVKPYAIANHFFDKAENLFAKVILENGTVGTGAGSPSEYVCGENIDDSLEKLRQFANELVAQNIFHFPAMLRNVAEQFPDHPAAMATLDIALHDAFTQLHDIGIADYYGKIHSRLPTSITLGILSMEESKKEIAEFEKQGFKIVKVKIGEDPQKDLELCKAIHSWTKGKLKIRVDGNQGYTSNDLSIFIKGTSDIGVEFIEQPLPRNEWHQMDGLTWDIRSKTMADEDLHNPKDALALLSPERLPFGLFNIKLMKCGGIARGKQIADLANYKDVNLMWGCMDESRVSIAAALHVAFSCQNTKYLDLDGHLDLAEDLVKGGFTINDGFMELTDSPGLGLQALF